MSASDHNPFAAALDALTQAQEGSPAGAETPDGTGTPSRSVRATRRAGSRGRRPNAGLAPTPEEQAEGRAPVLATVAVPLEAFGLDAQRDHVVAQATEVLAARGHAGVRVVGFRWGCLTLEADGVIAQALRVDADQILAALTALGTSTVAELRVRTRRG